MTATALFGHEEEREEEGMSILRHPLILAP